MTYANAFLILAGLNFLGGVLFLFAKKQALTPAAARTKFPQRAAEGREINPR